MVHRHQKTENGRTQVNSGDCPIEGALDVSSLGIKKPYAGTASWARKMNALWLCAPDRGKRAVSEMLEHPGWGAEAEMYRPALVRPTQTQRLGSAARASTV